MVVNPEHQRDPVRNPVLPHVLTVHVTVTTLIPVSSEHFFYRGICMMSQRPDSPIAISCATKPRPPSPCDWQFFRWTKKSQVWLKGGGAKNKSLFQSQDKLRDSIKDVYKVKKDYSEL